MNNTMHTHRLYVVLATLATMLLLSVAPAAAGVNDPGPSADLRQRGLTEVDGWIYGRGAATNTVKAQVTTREDGWVRGGGLQSLSPVRRVPVDGWAIGGGLRSQSSQPGPTVGQPRPSTTPISLSTIVLGLLIAAVLGAGAAAAVAGHRRIPSAH